MQTLEKALAMIAAIVLMTMSLAYSLSQLASFSTLIPHKGAESVNEATRLVALRGFTVVANGDTVISVTWSPASARSEFPVEVGAECLPS